MQGQPRDSKRRQLERVRALCVHLRECGFWEHQGRLGRQLQRRWSAAGDVAQEELLAIVGRALAER